jgi:hypothetical protein
VPGAGPIAWTLAWLHPLLNFQAMEPPQDPDRFSFFALSRVGEDRKENRMRGRMNFRAGWDPDGRY